MSNPESDGILAPGVIVNLRNKEGETRDVSLVYDMLGIKALEDTFGTLEGAVNALSGVFGGATVKRIDAVINLLACGLLGAGLTPLSMEPVDPRKLTAILEEVSVELYAWTDFRAIRVYVQTIDSALGQALPRAAEGTSPNGKTTDGPSPGSASTDSSSSTADAALVSSGT